MRKALLLLLAGLAGIILPATAQENLVSNPGFESAASDGNLAGGWWLSESIGETKINIDDAVAHGGKASARLTSPAAEKCVLVSKKFEVEPGDELRFGAWVRGANLSQDKNRVYAGLVFRQADTKVMERHYVPSSALGGGWVFITGTAQVPVDATSAEIHLGYTNGPGTLWYDDVSAVITNAVSLSLLEEAKPWPGEQDLLLHVVNRQTRALHGTISAQIGKKKYVVPVVLTAKSAGKFKVPIALSGVGQHAYKISVLDETGSALKTINGKFKTSEALVLFPPDPCCDIVGSDTVATLIDARVNLNPAKRAGMKLVVNGVAKPLSSGDITETSVPISCATTGAFPIKAVLVDSTGDTIAAAESDVHVVAPEAALVRVGEDGYLRVAGKAEFPIGLYSSSRDEELARAGFNATHNYNVSSGETTEVINHTEPQLKELLDESWASDLRMMVELPRKAIEKGDWAQVTRRVETFRHHPGLLCWGSEERVARGMTSPVNIAALYALVHKLDPDHPLVLGDTRDVIQHLQVDRRDFFPDASMDVGIWWWYPFPLKAVNASALEGTEGAGDVIEAPSWLTTTHSKKPLWIAIQSYQKPARDSRFPTPAEYRCEAYLSIIYGVKGLFFYTGSGQKDYLGKPAGILNKPEEGHWDNVKKLAGELQDFSPVIMAPRAAEKIELTPPNADVEFTTRELEDKIYLIAANKSAQTQKAHWQGELLQGKKASVMFEEGAAKVDGDGLSDEFPAFGVRVYRLE